MSPSMDCKHDNVGICWAYLNTHCQKVAESLWLSCQMFVLVLWNLWNKKLGQLSLLIMNVLEVFNSNMWWWYWKFLDMGIIGMTFLGRPSSFTFCSFMFFSMKSLNWRKYLLGDALNVFLYPFWIYEGHIFDVSNAFVYNFEYRI
jgi:hypothetical protein